MTVDLGNSIRVRDRYMIRLNPDQSPILFMCFIDREIANPLPGLQKQPQIRPCGREGSGDGANRSIAEVGKKIIDDWEKEESIWRQECG